MIRLASIEPEWKDLLPGVRVQFGPVSVKAGRAAHRALRASLDSDPDDLEAALYAFGCELLRRGIRDWEGVAGDDGTSLPVSPDSIEGFVADPRTYDAAHQAYVAPWLSKFAAPEPLPVEAPPPLKKKSRRNR